MARWGFAWNTGAEIQERDALPFVYVNSDESLSLSL